ncbi:hypothetical protein M2244_003543 [Rhodoferax antarcticus]|uniref:Uncharacterized protein n=1 Tax=Rhodoferax antarcticus ANT.BR TaxID=1111071 RepID=A0A1Q8YJC7_9BURK|nr:hypothetical protein [Rhodoferax antarcticus]OLP08136.1 hypothetical protein BLL52_0424 [Rhodoferax antarcticus ANT.BR]
MPSLIFVYAVSFLRQAGQAPLLVRPAQQPVGLTPSYWGTRKSGVSPTDCYAS